MAIKTKQIVIDDAGRDQGKIFILTEMPSSKVEKWAIKAFLAMSRGGFDVPSDIAEKGLAGIAILGINALGNLHFEDAEPLLDEMFLMITHLPDPSKPAIKKGFGGVAPIDDNDIEEVATRLKLRKEIILLHIDFFMPAARLSLNKP